MKRGEPLKRRTPLKAKTGIKATTIHSARTRVMNPMSVKRKKAAPKRRAFVAEILERFPWCQAAIEGVCEGRSVTVHEPFTRGRSGGGVEDITDPANSLSVCNGCHRHIHANPRESTARGFLRRTRHV